jgi:hypothetical protein
MQMRPSISIDNAGNFTISWEDDRNGNIDIYAQRFSSDGTAQGSNFKVNDDPGNTEQVSSSICMGSNGNFIIVWEDRRNFDYDIFGQKYLSDGTPLGTNFRLTNTGEWAQTKPDVKLWNNLIYCTWEDNRSGMGMDIWANVLDWNDPADIKENNKNKIPSAYVLHQNYPNPFNPTTKINYELQITNYVDLSIYNTLGQKVTTLLSQRQNAGIYQVQWDATEYAGGVYYYQLNAGEFQDVKKMILIK